MKKEKKAEKKKLKPYGPKEVKKQNKTKTN